MEDPERENLLSAGGKGQSLTESQQKIPTAKEQWTCAMLVLLSHFTVELPQIWYVLCVLLNIKN